MFVPCPAIVRPRVMLSNSEGTMLLDDAIAARLEARQWGLILLVGSARSGKSTALAHVAHIFVGDSRVVVHDQPSELDYLRLETAAKNGIAIIADPVTQEVNSSGVPKAELIHEVKSSSVPKVEIWSLARWLRDDLIEYLLAKHRDQCASVMTRVSATKSRHRLGGNPELWSIVLDRMAVDPSLLDPVDALRAALHSSSIDRGQLNGYRTHCFARLMNPATALLHEVSNPHDPWYERLVRHDIVQQILAAEHVVRRLQDSIPVDILSRRLPARLVREIASQLRGDHAALVHLSRAATGDERAVHAMSISILHAAGSDWQPAHGRAPRLNGALLPGVQWPGTRLSHFHASDAVLNRADLSESSLRTVYLDRAQLSQARLHGARLHDLSAVEARFEGADLSFVRAREADFTGANMCGANLEGAMLRQAQFMRANLSHAHMCRADLLRSNLSGANVEGADFTGANLTGCNLRGLRLCKATLSGAIMQLAILDDCDLEGVQLPGAALKSASLIAANLTGSYMPGAQMQRAILVGAKLAEVDWQGADLRDVDFETATFHMGSSRSGLVGSPFASEGTRTGFYTDDYTEQGFKSPEEIRKANLCRADLRDAKVEKVDFYLVDLRGALYSPEQEEHFRRCKAILGAYV